MKVKQRNSILGLSFEGKSMGICLMHRRGGLPRIEKRLRVPLLLDPLNGEAELVGREIRNQLEAAGIRERQCVACLPLSWMLTLHADLPRDLSGEDLESYIALQAERALPYAPEDMMMGVSQVRTAEGPGLATIVAIARNAVESLERVFRAAGLKATLIAPAVSTLPLGSPGAALIVGEAGLDLAVHHGGGFALIRSLDEAMEAGPDGVEWDHELIARQIRISLGRLPQEVRERMRTIVVYGEQEHALELLDGLAGPLKGLGLEVRGAQIELAGSGIEPAQWTPAAALAGLSLSGRELPFNFLPPRVGRLKQLAGKVSGRGAVYLGGGAGALVLGLIVMFTLQWRELSNLEAEWKEMKPRADQVEKVQANVRTYRPWFDPSAQSLTIASQIVNAFPETGSVWVKSLAIKDLQTVTCTGMARSRLDLPTLNEKLIKTPGIADLQTQSLTEGNGQVRFNLSFKWVGGSANGQ